MKLRLRLALLMCLAAAAVFTGAEAYRSLRPARQSALSPELYAPYASQADSAEYVIRASGGYVTVFGGRRGKEPVAVTAIALTDLRDVDRAMVERGIPAADRKEMLSLLEDLGS